MQPSDVSAIGTPLLEWHQANPESFNDMQMAELQILKFQTVEQVAMASDMQIQRVGMGADGLRERARQFLAAKNQTASAKELDETKAEIEALKKQVAELTGKRARKGD